MHSFITLEYSHAFPHKLRHTTQYKTMHVLKGQTGILVYVAYINSIQYPIIIENVAEHRWTGGKGTCSKLKPYL